jgi:predicted nuclease of predicted toxin-antitoxin system
MVHVADMLRHAGHIAHVQGPQTFGTGTHDVDWLPKVGKRGWILITKDKNIRKREIELRALKQARVRAFVLTATHLRGEEQARVLNEALPAMVRLLRRKAASFLANISADSNVQILEIDKYITD